ncbi:MAG: FAD-dependent monooxygenase [Clostridia bacterium]|nr:FAD-dependent monooxygenase [Clostridia bacterium]
MDSVDCEVLVVGSGPAGASAACWLSRLGVEDAVVLERLSEGQHRRYHSVCGEAVSARMLRTAGIGTDYSVREVGAIEISVNGSEPSEVRVKGHVIDRNAMIEGLLSSSSAVRMHGRAVSVSETEDGFSVETAAGRIRCKALIGADGAHSVVRRDVFGSRPEFMVKAVNTLKEVLAE